MKTVEEARAAIGDAIVKQCPPGRAALAWDAIADALADFERAVRAEMQLAIDELDALVMREFPTRDVAEVSEYWGSGDEETIAILHKYAPSCRAREEG